MNRTIILTPRRLILIGLLGIFGTLTVGIAAANSMPASTNAGDGSAAISGYTVSNVHYVLNGTTPSNVDSVSFTTAPAIPAGGNTRISLNGGTNWLAAGACTVTGANVSCNAAGTAVTTLTNLRVVAAQ
jgi:hypothetical protein